MSAKRKRILFVVAILILLAGVYAFWMRRNAQPAEVSGEEDTPISATLTAALIPKTILIPDKSPFKDSIVDAGDYLVRQELLNGELSYQVDFMTGERSYSPSYLRLIAGTGSLYTVCRVAGQAKYCNAGDLALDHYLEGLVTEPENFKGSCLYTSGVCQLGGSALAVDAIYKRWQATGNLLLKERNLLETAIELGKFILSMRKPEGGFYHSFDPHYAGTVDENFFVIDFPGESLTALLELYEITGNQFWLKQAREVNDFMIKQPVTEDYSHAYAFSMFARLDKLSKADINYAKQIAQTVIDGNVRSLNPANTTNSTATKVEALAALAQAFYLSGVEHKWLDPDIRAFMTFVQARQLPNNNCGWTLPNSASLNFGGGVYLNCEDPSIRIDGVQHWINGATTYLEYQSMIAGK